MWMTSMRKIKQIREDRAELCHTGTFIARAYSTVVVLVATEIDIFSAHKCPACVFSCMYNSELLKHFKIHNDRTIQQRCDLCKVYVTDIKTHMKVSHPKCCSCEKSFLDLQALKIHKPFCNQVKVEDFSQKKRMIYSNPHRRAFKSMGLN